MNKSGAVTKGTAIGSVSAGFLAAICCLGPLVLGVFGFSSVALMAILTPYQKIFSIIAVVLLGTGFYFAYKKPKECADGCDLPSSYKLNRKIMWIAASLSLLFISFPFLRQYLP